MKKMELKEAKPYEAPGHFDVSTLRLHDKEVSGSEKFIVGVSHFLPGGGCEMGGSPPEKIYYVLSGEITVKTETDEFTMGPNDSVFIGPNENRAIVNNTNEPVTMLVVIEQT